MEGGNPILDSFHVHSKRLWNSMLEWQQLAPVVPAWWNYPQTGQRSMICHQMHLVEVRLLGEVKEEQATAHVRQLFPTS
jgi:hypothetical protein